MKYTRLNKTNLSTLTLNNLEPGCVVTIAQHPTANNSSYKIVTQYTTGANQPYLDFDLPNDHYHVRVVSPEYVMWHTELDVRSNQEIHVTLINERNYH